MNGSSLRSDLRATSPQVTEIEGMTDIPRPPIVGRAEVAQCGHGEKTPVALDLL